MAYFYYLNQDSCVTDGRTDQWMDRQTDRQTDTPSDKDARTHLKTTIFGISKRPKTANAKRKGPTLNLFDLHFSNLPCLLCTV